MGADGANRHAGLCADLRKLRLQGVPKARTLDIPWLLSAATELGYRAPDTSIDLAVESLLRDAVTRLGESREAISAARSFGLTPGHKLWKPADRRRAAAQAQGVSVETFRKSYEIALIDQLATEILAMLNTLPPSEQPDTEPPETGPRTVDPVVGAPRREPIFSREHHVADVLRIAHANADWGLVEGVYRQCVAIAEDHDGRFMPDAIPAFFAEALGRISANYHDREEELILHGLGILGNAEQANKITPALFKQLYADDRFDRFVQYSAGGDPRRTQRRPCPFETLLETARRYRDMNQLQLALSDIPTSGVLGGSVNYGRYFSVRGSTGQQPGSNVDLMIVIEDYAQLDEAVSCIAQLPGSAPSSLSTLEQRARVWRENRLDDGSTMFSHRILMWSDEDDPVMVWAPNRGEYHMDLRIVSSSVLDWILVADNPILSASAAANSRSIRDFRQHETRREEHQRSFSGRNLRTKLDAVDVAGSLLRTHRVYSIQGGRYYPGYVQNLILPRFNKRWDELPIRGTLEAFRWKIIERLRHERRQHPYELLRVSLSHTRSEMFAPHILRAVDSADIT